MTRDFSLVLFFEQVHGTLAGLHVVGQPFNERRRKLRQGAALVAAQEFTEFGLAAHQPVALLLLFRESHQAALHFGQRLAQATRPVEAFRAGRKITFPDGHRKPGGRAGVAANGLEVGV
jgi:hypothetical protein